MKIKESWFKDYHDTEDSLITDTYLNTYKNYLESLHPRLRYKECISGFNRIQRWNSWSAEPYGIEASVGDICYIDYGHAYINEAGYQHFGLVIAEFNYKLLVVPMTSNASTIHQARNVDNSGKPHLYFLGKVKGLNKPSVLFLNDAKFINSSRVITINGHIEKKSIMFKEILHYLISEILRDDMLE